MYSTKENVKESFRLAWKYKILWVFALLFAMGGSGGSSGGSGGSDSDTQEFNFPTDESTNVKTELNVGISENKPEDAEFVKMEDKNYEELMYDKSPFEKLVLGARDSAQDIVPIPTPISEDDTFQGIDSPLSTLGDVISIPMIVILLASFVAFLLYVIVLGIMVRNWARGAHLEGTRLAQKGAEKLDLFSLSKAGLYHINGLFRLSILVALYVIGAFVLLVIPVPFFFFNKTVAIVIGVVLFVLSIILLVRTLLGALYAERYIVFNNHGARESLKKGVGNFRKNKKLTFFLAGINIFIILLFVIVVVGTVFAAFLSILSNQNAGSGNFGLLWFLLFPIMIIIVTAFQLAGGFLTTYRQFTWTRLFFHIQEQGVEEAKLTGEEK